MPNYNSSRIYKIWSRSCPDVYIGATTQPLCFRMGKHRTALKSGKVSDAFSRILTGDDCRIDLIEVYDAASKEHLNARVSEIIKMNPNFITK